jgi:hypothetical protein
LSGSKGSSYGRGAAILSVGIGATGLITFAYFSLASHALPEAEYGRITLLWSAVFITVSVLYRPVEQLLSRTIADHDARGVKGTEHLRVAATIQLGLGLLFVVVALALRGPIQDDLFAGSSTLYWILVVAVLAYAASYFARGYLAGHRLFPLYGGLVLMEATSRCLFALAVAVGIAEGQTAVALGMAAAPIVSLAVVPPALALRLDRERSEVVDPADAADPGQLDAAARDEPAAREPEFTLARGTGFAAAVLVVMLCEQTFLNAGPLLVKATAPVGGAALAGFAFNVLLIARARFAGIVALVMLVAGPTVMDVLFGGNFDYDRVGLVLVSLGMGLYLSAATLNQALLAHAKAGQSATCWAACAITFVLFLLLADFDDRVLQVEVAFVAAAALLAGSLYALYSRA